LVLLALADHDHAVHRHRVEHVAHRVDRGLVGALLVAAADHPGRRERGRLGHADQLEREVPVRARGSVAVAHGSPGGLRVVMLSLVRATDPIRIRSPPRRPIHQPKLIPISPDGVPGLSISPRNRVNPRAQIAMIAVISPRGHDSAWPRRMIQARIAGATAATSSRKRITNSEFHAVHELFGPRQFPSTVNLSPSVYHARNTEIPRMA